MVTVSACVVVVVFFPYNTDLSQTFSVEPADVIVSSPSDVAMFVCRIGGAPSPRIRWYKDDGEIRSSGDSQGPNQYVVNSVQGEGLLEIPTVRASDVGRYRCVADNGLERPRYSRYAQLTLSAASIPNLR